MKSLGNLIRKYIAENGLTIYKTAAMAGVNRTTLQKVLSDERNASEELIKKLLSILKLSPSEEKELRELFEIQQIGEDVYLQRQYIKRSIEAMAGLDGWFSHSPAINETSFAFQEEELIVQAESSLVRGLPSVRHLFYTSIARYAQRKEGAELLLYAPGKSLCPEGPALSQDLCRRLLTRPPGWAHHSDDQSSGGGSNAPDQPGNPV